MVDCWSATESSDHGKRCVLAHYLADTEPELDADINWDEQAIDEHSGTMTTRP